MQALFAIVVFRQEKLMFAIVIPFSIAEKHDFWKYFKKKKKIEQVFVKTSDRLQCCAQVKKK